ncbi:gamma-glutamyltransferase [Paenibacillus sp. Marseille-Q4541]|uniref:gamma-glutamyltransferase n=1 Tax=Paenibacillus sp. Marseille-Q4541 TaxID=2831522 RepID=UPI001BA57A71|nr:gamma-glutamyltransferase [Paenibacillus sp. Marseille-Q4541]
MLNQMPVGMEVMVTSPHVLATSAGARILAQGGNAYDASIAVSIALGVVYPHMTGPGGDAFFLMYNEKSGELSGYNGTGRSASSVTREMFEQMNMISIPSRGVLSAVTVPGMVDAWWEVSHKFGRLPWDKLFEPAIQYAEKGCPVSHNLHMWMIRDEAYIRADKEMTSVYIKDGILLAEGDLLIQPQLAHSLRILQSGGKEAFYKGILAEAISVSVIQDGGFLQKEDFEKHTGEWVTPVKTTYHEYEVCQMPPNSQGFSVLMMLNMLENTTVSSLNRLSAPYYHLMTEVIKKSFRDRDQYLTDPDFRNIPLDQLLSKPYAKQLWDEVTESAEEATPFLSQAMGQDTAYAAVVDSEGNAVSFIQSLYFDFGSGYMAKNTGIILQNRGSFFSLDPDAANVLEPGKRTFHTLMPGMVMKEGKPYLLLGTQGGEGQPQTQLSILTAVLDYGCSIQEAISLPRWVYGRTWGEDGDELKLEQRFGIEVIQQLEAMGHEVRPLGEWDDVMGQAQGIMIGPNGMLSGAADPRGDGAAIGW